MNENDILTCSECLRQEDGNLDMYICTDCWCDVCEDCMVELADAQGYCPECAKKIELQTWSDELFINELFSGDSAEEQTPDYSNAQGGDS